MKLFSASLNFNLAFKGLFFPHTLKRGDKCYCNEIFDKLYFTETGRPCFCHVRRRWCMVRKKIFRLNLDFYGALGDLASSYLSLEVAAGR